MLWRDTECYRNTGVGAGRSPPVHGKAYARRENTAKSHFQMNSPFQKKEFKSLRRSGSRKYRVP